jgi:hypothetical protein
MSPLNLTQLRKANARNCVHEIPNTTARSESKELQAKELGICRRVLAAARTIRTRSSAQPCFYLERTGPRCRCHRIDGGRIRTLMAVSDYERCTALNSLRRNGMKVLKAIRDYQKSDTRGMRGVRSPHENFDHTTSLKVRFYIVR